MLGELNSKQKEAAFHRDGPLLIMAGAGSGKTRVLTHRIAHLISHEKISPFNILAVTFTNKAANEMKERLARLIGSNARNVWVGTFHAICGRILRADIEHLGWKSNFTIIDSDDAQSLIKKLIKELELPDKRFRPYTVMEAISRAKNSLQTPREVENSAQDYFEEKIALVFRRYQEDLWKLNSIDFDDMLCFCVELFRKCPEVLEKYQKRFLYLNIDEYQDTNYSQYFWVKLLAQKYRNLCVVGDSDQSIYSWRGADFRNILNFERDYPEARIVVLEQNYRSSKNILEAANHVIKNNTLRREKNLWTENQGGEEISYYEAVSERDEANYVADEILKKSKKGFLQFAVLYRTHAQSRVIEEVFLQKGLPYRIFSGLRFYERKEIKDVLAYLRLIFNPSDDLSLLRLLQNAVSGIGKATIKKLQEEASRRRIILFEIFEHLDQLGLSRSQGNILKSFGQMVTGLKARSLQIKVADFLEELLVKTGYKKLLEDEATEEALTRVENIKELVSVAKEFEKDSEDKSLEAFLTQISLVTDQDQKKESTDFVTLMTLHGAKGLEFPFVFLVGMEEGIFPHYRSLFSSDELEEERRLCYVGITRAQKKLVFTSALERLIFGDRWANGPSRFLSEIPEHLLAKKSLGLEDENKEEKKSAEVYQGFKLVELPDA